MKKLRLIKPWDLEPVYMQTAGARPDFTDIYLTPAGCSGPQAPETDEDADGRFGPSYRNCRPTNGAPVSVAIFATVTNPRMG